VVLSDHLQRQTEANIEKAFREIRNVASQEHRSCVCRLFSSLYFAIPKIIKTLTLLKAYQGPRTEKLQKLAAELHVVIMLPSLKKWTQAYFNTAAVFDADGTYLGKYRKNHIPDDPGFYEKFYFAPGDSGYKVFDTTFGKIGILICWDQWYPEAARITSLMGARILFYPTAIGWASSQTGDTNTEQYQAWQTIQRAHAVANGVHVVSVNRTGLENDMNFWVVQLFQSFWNRALSGLRS
jgi:N-carbamoylputrescine amidase